MANQTNNLLLVDGTTNLPTKYASGDTVQIAELDLTAASGIALNVTADASIGGDLTVSGDVISRGSVDVIISDQFLDLAFGNTTTTATSGGITVSMNRNSGFTASTVTTFVAGVNGVSNPTFTSTDAGSSSLFAAGDIVMISGAGDAGNDGLFEVSAVDQASFPQVVTIKGTGTSAVNGSLPFCQSQFAAASGDTASATRIDLSVLCFADGTTSFKNAAGSAYAKGTFLTAYATDAELDDFNGNGDYKVASTTLQAAYDGGNAITTSGSNPVAITLAADAAGFSVQGNTGGDGDVSIGGTTAVSSFAISASGAASTINTTGQNLSISTSSSGELDLTSAGNLDLNGVAVTVDGSAGISLGGSGAASDFTSAGQSLTIETTTSGDIDITSAATLDIGCVALELDSTGGATVALSGGASSITSTAQNLSISTATSGELDLTSAGNLDLNGVAVTVDGSGGVSIGGAGAASDFTSAGQDLTVQTTTSGTLTIDGAGVVDINAGANLDIDVTGTAALDASGNITIESSAGTIAVGANDIDQNIGIGTNGERTISVGSATGTITANSTGGASVYTIKDATASAFSFNDGSNTLVSVNTATEQLQLNNVGMGLGLSNGTGGIAQAGLTAGEALAIGNVVTIDSTAGKVYKSDANGAGNLNNVLGVAVQVSSGDGQAAAMAIQGIQSATFTGVVATTAIGGFAFLSQTPGVLTTTVPGAGRVYKAGIVVGANGTTTAQIMVQPQFIQDI